MTYAINGTTLTMQPTTARWLPRKMRGYSGTGHPIYPNVREFQFVWNVNTPGEYNQIVGFFNSVGVTGTAVVSLPQFGASTYTFFAYSGCVVNEPEMGDFFTENHTEISLLVTNIRT